MFRKGTRVVVVDEKAAKRMMANVSNGDKGTIGVPTNNPLSVHIHLDNDSLSKIPWIVPSACVKRIPKQKQKK